MISRRGGFFVFLQSLHSRPPAGRSRGTFYETKGNVRFNKEFLKSGIIPQSKDLVGFSIPLQQDYAKNLQAQSRQNHCF